MESVNDINHQEGAFMNKEQVESEIAKLKRKISRNIDESKYDIALQEIKLCAKILYETNLYYMDEELENNLLKVSKNVVNSYELKETKNEVVFYDGFGLNSRGLVQIYLNALCKSHKVTYITDIVNSERIPNVLQIVQNNGGRSIFIQSKTPIEQVCELSGIVNQVKPSHFFFYSKPEDVVGVTVLYGYCDKMKRYQINLTDHAFWLGAHAIDMCIEFRDYGASISEKHRKISKGKLTKILFYPSINKEIRFQGYPFKEKNKNTKVIFSGGALYKTLGADNLYYKIIEHILINYENTIFWYAGSGDTTEMDKLIKAYPERVYLTEERTDLYQILQHCDLYLSTYPVCGGLMFQYVACAGRVPVTLKYGHISDGFLINQDELEIENVDLENLYTEIKRLLSDQEYLLKKEQAVSRAVVKKEEFETQVEMLLEGKEIMNTIKYEDLDEYEFRKEYLDRFSYSKLCELVAEMKTMQIYKVFPLKTMIGILEKVKKHMCLKK